MVVLTVEDLSKSFGVDPLFEDVNFGIQDTDKIGIIGANGAGKSTLLKILSGLIPPDSGRIAINREARIEYLSQAPDLDPELTAFDQVLIDGPKAFEVVQRYEAALAYLEANPHDERAMERVSELGAEMEREGGWTIEAEAKGTLGNLGVHDQRQLIGTMSGGQRKRVALARALIRPADLLILDEPTNHLDVDTVAWLEDHLAARQGALMLVTHDRYFLDRTVEHLFVFEDDNTLVEFPGDFTSWSKARDAQRAEDAARAKAEAETAKPAGAPKKTPSKKLGYKEQRELESLETEIPELEDRLEALDEAMVTHAADFEELGTLQAEREEVEQRLELAMERWMELEERAEG